MVTSTPPTLSNNGNGPNSSGGFQPAQQFGLNVNAGATFNPLQQFQLLMAQQQRGNPPNLQQILANNLRQFLSYTQGLQQARQQQEHGNSMLNSPVPTDLGLLSAFHTSTPLVNSDTSSSPSQLFFLSPQTPVSTNQQGQNSSDGSFQMPLGALNNAQSEVSGVAGPAKPPQRRRNRQGGPTVKTAEVWRFFKQKPPPEQAAVCDICDKTIKATNSSTTGMIRHLRSCHREQHEILEKARYQANIFKTLSSCTDEKSRDDLMKALSSSSDYLAKTLNHSSTATTRHDSSTNSSVSPNSTASSSAVDNSLRTQLLLQNSSGIHSIDSLLDSSAESKASNSMASDQAAPPSAVFTSPTKYMVKVKSELTRVEHEAKNAIEARNENLNVEEEYDEDEQDEDVENLAVTEEDSEEDASLVSNPKRQRLEEDSNKNRHHFQRQKSTKQSAQAENIEKNIALMLLLDDLPTDIVDQPGFRHLIANLVPTYPLPSAADFKNKILPHMRSQLPNGDVSLLRQRFLENNRFSPGHTSTQANTVHWPISPSTTCESGFDEIVDALSETPSSASMNHIVEQSVRSAQNISQSFGFSTPLNLHHQQNLKSMKKFKNLNEIIEKQKDEVMAQVKVEETPSVKQELGQKQE